MGQTILRVKKTASSAFRPQRRTLAATLLIGLAACAFAAEPTTRAALADAPDASVSGVETVVFLRHGEKPTDGLGQLTPQGLNRALALSSVLPQKFGKPDFIFAPDPAQQVGDHGGRYDYVRPLVTIEPTAIRLEMPVHTSFGYKDTTKLIDELAKPKYAHAMIFVAWEHGQEVIAAQKLMTKFNVDSSIIPKWPGNDYDSLYVIKITRAPGHAANVVFAHEHEGLDGQSKQMPAPASH